MQTLKTSVVVAFMLTVLYGAYVALNAPQPVPTTELGELTDIESMNIDIGVDIPPLDPPPGLAGLDPSLEIDSKGAASAKLADSPSNSGISQTSGVSQSLTDLPEAKLTPLPKPDRQVAGANIDQSAAYPKTESPSIELPDPSSLARLSANTTTKPAASDKTDALPSPPLTPQEKEPKPLSGNNKPKDNASSLKNAFVTAERQVKEGRLREALFTLSIFYGSPDVAVADQKKLLDLLDHLAGEVIYSTGHFLEDAHKVARGETLKQIADKHAVPVQLLANINRIENPEVLLPGTELKVVTGPFRAEVNLTRNEITLFLGDLYAGRFPMTVGQNPAPAEGTYTILEKKQGAEMGSLGDGSFGDIWIDLGRKMCIHGSPSSSSDPRNGCIRLSPVDARDLFGILSQGSPVAIRR